MSLSSNFKEEIYKKLPKNINHAMKRVVLFTIIGAILLGIFIYSIVHIVEIIQFYYSQRQKLRDTTDATKQKQNNPLDPKNDNNLYFNVDRSMYAENNDEYKKYTNEINKSIVDFRIYNEKLKAFYEQNRSGAEAKDTIDKGIISSDKDNY